MIIRKARLEDIQDIATIHVNSWQIAYKGLIPQNYLDNLSIPQREKNWRNILNDTNTSTIVQEISGEIIGFANFGNTRDRDRDSSTVGEITSIYLSPGYWRQGLGKKLIEFILQEMKNQEFTQITLWVLDSNQRACSFYEKIGFKPDGIFKTDIREGFVLREIRYSINLIL